MVDTFRTAFRKQAKKAAKKWRKILEKIRGEESKTETIIFLDEFDENDIEWYSEP